MRVPDQVSKCVLFVGLPDSEPDPYRGTSYIVTVPGRNQNHFAFMVTARHVAEKLQGENFNIRANKKRGGTAELRGLADNPWWYHPTEREAVDCAVTMFAPSQIRELDIEHIPIDLFLDDQKTREHNIGVGDEVFIAGLFTKVADTSRNIPIVRTGNVAMIPGEEIYFNDRFIAANLIESRSIGGLSGSPVFVRPTLQLQIAEEGGKPIILNGPGRIFFFGSVIGHWEVPAEDFKITVAEAVNMGIAPVVPAQKIREVIMQDALVEIMKNIDDEMRAQNQRGARLDFAPSSKGETQVTDGGATIPVPTAEQFFEVVKKASRKIVPGKS